MKPNEYEKKNAEQKAWEDEWVRYNTRHIERFRGMGLIKARELVARLASSRNLKTCPHCGNIMGSSPTPAGGTRHEEEA